MANNYLITGYWGEPHVTAENDRGINAGIFGAGRFVLPVGEQFRAEYIGNNTIRMYDGKLLDNGAAAGIPAGEFVDLLISGASQGMKRNDLIVFQYEQDASTMVEKGTFIVVQGTETDGTAVDPELTQSDLLTNKAIFDQMALWRVPVSGATISAPVQLFTVSKSLSNVGDGDYIETSEKGAASGVATLGTDGKVPSGQLPSMNYIPTSQKGAASGVASLDASGKVPSGQLPSMDYIPTNQKGAASGVATLNADGGLTQWFSEIDTTLSVYDSRMASIGSVAWTQIGKLAIGSVSCELATTGSMSIVSLYARIPSSISSKTIKAAFATFSDFRYPGVDVQSVLSKVGRTNLVSSDNPVICVSANVIGDAIPQGVVLSINASILVVVD